MIIQRVSQNKFAACDDEGRRAGTARVRRLVMDRIFPDRPVQYVIEVESSPESRHLLYGAAVSRARVLASEEPAAHRVYADVDGTDSLSLEILGALGFKNRDGIVRMVKPVTNERVLQQLPQGFTMVRDFLQNPAEFQKCLKRYNECFCAKNDASWLRSIMEYPNFARLMVVSQSGIASELMVWSSGSTGVIGIIQTARDMRGRGFATYLLEDARKYFAKLGLKSMSFDVWRASPGCMPLAESADFKASKILRVYPEMV